MNRKTPNPIDERHTHSQSMLAIDGELDKIKDACAGFQNNPVIVLMQHVSWIYSQGVVHINLGGLGNSEHLTSALSSASAHRAGLLIKSAKRPGRVIHSGPRAGPKPIV